MPMKELLTVCCKNLSNRDLPHHALHCGAPLAQGVLRDLRALAIRSGRGRLLPVQARVTEYWPDRSIKWLVMDFALPFEANESQEVAVVQAVSSRAPATKGIVVEERPDSVTVSSAGEYRIVIGKKRFSLFRSYHTGGKEMMIGGSDIMVEDLAGKRWYASLARRLQVRVVEKGPLRAVVEVCGRHTAEDDSEMLNFRVRYTVLAHDACCMLSYKFTNREEPETGVKLAGIRLVLPTALGDRTTKYIRQNAHGEHWYARPVEIGENVELIAGKTVNEESLARYALRPDVWGDGRTVIRNFASLRENLGEYPYYLRPGGSARTDIGGGLRQTYPYIGANGAGRSLLGWFCEMENHYPKAVLLERNALRFDIWPASYGELRVRRGQSKEHDLMVNFAGKSRRFEEIESVYLDHEVRGYAAPQEGGSPVTWTLDPAYVRSCKVLHLDRWLRYDEEKYCKIEIKLGSLGAAPAAPRGMWEYGDFSFGAGRNESSNNENDVLLQQLQEFFRRAEPTCLAAAIAKARHNAQVDFIAYDPNPLRQGTMPAHCPEHTDGATYPSHMWVDGLLAAYCVTGQEDFRDAALSVGENMLRWQRQRTTFYGDSRECGWPMLAFLRLSAHTRQERWLKAAGEVFEFYRDNINAKGEILCELPHGMATFKQAYGNFIAWRACFFYYEMTRQREVKDFLVKSLPNVYFVPAKQVTARFGWASNDLFPAWALYALTGEKKYLEANYPFLREMMAKPGDFNWGGNDMHFYLGELDRLGELEQFVQELRGP